MKVLSFTTLFPNPAQPLHGLFVRARLRALAQFAEVRVVAPVYGPSWFVHGRQVKDVPLREDQEGLSVTHPRFFNVPKYLKSTDAALLARSVRKHVEELAREFRPDVMDAHFGWPDGAAAGRLARRLGLPYFVTVRGDDVNEFIPTRSRGRGILRSLHGAAKVIGVCQDLVDGVVAAGVPAAQCCVIPNGVDLDRFRPESREEARRRLELPAAEPVVLYVGRLSPEKGVDLLLRSFAELSSPAGRRAHLALVGPLEKPAFVARLRADAEAFGVAERVRFAGGCASEELRWWYSAADVFGLASTREGWPNVLLESLACGCPVVAVDVGGVREVIPSPELGRVVPREAAALRDALDAGLEGTWDRPAIVEHARGHGWEAVGKRCHDLFEETLQARASRV